MGYTVSINDQTISILKDFPEQFVLIPEKRNVLFGITLVFWQYKYWAFIQFTTVNFIVVNRGRQTYRHFISNMSSIAFFAGPRQL